MDKELAAIVIPVYKPELTWWEKISLKQVFRVLGKYTIFFAVPQDRDLPFTHIFPQTRIKEFPSHYFDGIAGYNKLMLSTEFYDSFCEYKYVLIHQLDALVFSDRLKEFVHLDYDYIGAPWFFWYWIVMDKKPVRLHVGNGGFSLRNVEKCRWLLEKYAQEARTWSVGEDAFWGFYGKLDKDFKRADVKTARDFSFEAYPKRMWQRNGYQMSFGCHGWHRYGKEFYCSIAGTLGEEIKQNAKLMDNRDISGLKTILHNYAKFRLLRRIQNKREIGIYLLNHHAYLQAENVYIQSDAERYLLIGLQKEGFLSEARIITNIETWKNGKCLLLAMENVDELIKSLLDSGRIYDKDFLSFWQEYSAYLRMIVKGSDDR